jgi:branched-chain amino acid transport system substrate-binding protein
MRKLASERKRIDIAVSAASTALTGSACTETGFHWAYDTYSNSIPLVRAMVGFRLNSWSFITLDNAYWTIKLPKARAESQRATPREIPCVHD